MSVRPAAKLGPADGRAEDQASQDADGDLVEDNTNEEAEQENRPAGNRLAHGVSMKRRARPINIRLPSPVVPTVTATG